MVVYPETRGTLVDVPIDFLTFIDDDINTKQVLTKQTLCVMVKHWLLFSIIRL